MSSDKKPSWKDALLSSGLPLEFTVTKLLTDRGCFVHGEYEFSVLQPDGTWMLRSLDLNGWWMLPTVNLNLLIECKYRRDNIKWVFLPTHQKVLVDHDWFTNCLVSPFIPPWYCDRKVVIPPVVAFGHHPPADEHVHTVGTKGIQILPGKGGDSNEKWESTSETPIRNALAQVIYGVARQQYDFRPIPRDYFQDYLHQVDFRFSIPMVVTTAELFVLNQTTDVQSIRSANSVDDVATRVGTVIVEKEHSHQLLNYVRVLLAQCYEGLLASPHTAEAATLWKSRMLGEEPHQSSLADQQARAAPQRVLVVALDHLPNLLDSWKTLFSHPDNLHQHEIFHGDLAASNPFDIHRHFAVNQKEVGEANP